MLGTECVMGVASAPTFIFSFPFEGKWWLCSLKYFRSDKAVGERLCDEGKWSHSGNDGDKGGRWRKVTAADGELTMNFV